MEEPVHALAMYGLRVYSRRRPAAPALPCLRRAGQDVCAAPIAAGTIRGAAMKIYTQTGDQGKTSLFSGERIFKDHIRVRAYGEVDELNAVIGALAAVLPAGAGGVAEALKQIQSDLFHAGAWLATTPDTDPQCRLTPITAEHSRRIETSIDAIQSQLPELKSFILPGGHSTAAWAHLARTVCRRAERTVVELVRHSREQQARQAREEALAAILVYLNRLSDYMFVLARWLNQAAGVADVIWQG